jgi:UDP-2,4-diacetamido-2,4,6-trideoxy-beta-L-altropyranose hydrolase
MVEPMPPGDSADPRNAVGVGCLVFRTDGGVKIGSGHVMRCLALAQAWQDQGGEVIFVMAQAPPTLESRVTAEGIEIARLAAPPGSAEDARQTESLARECGAEWVVVDGYQFDADYQRLLKGAGLRLLFIDDYGHAAYYWADLILNQNIHAQEKLYSARELYARLLLGSRYVLLRREFQEWRGWQRQIPEVAKNILVTLGGSDPDNVTLKVIQALSTMEMDCLEVVVAAGGANPHFQELQTATNNFSHRMRLLADVDHMPELMAWADLTISGGGSTCWESAFMGLPSMLIILSDDQRPIAQQLGEMGVAMNLGWHKDLTSAQLGRSLANLLTCKEIRATMGRRGRELVDGEGEARVVEALLR